MSPIPVTERTVCLFVSHLAKERLAPQTISSYLAAVSHLRQLVLALSHQSAYQMSVNSQENPLLLHVYLRRAKMDPFGKGVKIFLGNTGKALCPVSAILNYMAIHPEGEGPLLVLRDGRPLLKEVSIRKVRAALEAAGIDRRSYSGHSFRIRVATSAAALGAPAHLIKAMGQWTSEAYQLYIHTPPHLDRSSSGRLSNPGTSPSIIYLWTRLHVISLFVLLVQTSQAWPDPHVNPRVRPCLTRSKHGPNLWLS